MNNWLVEKEGHVTRVTLNRAEHLNNFNLETLGELKELSELVQRDNNCWVVVIQAAGKHFSTGMDVEVISQMAEQEEELYREYLRRAQLCIDEFEKIKQPIICKINGFCFGAGIIIAACCDFRLASKKSVFCLPEVKRSIGVIMGTYRVSRICGVANTKEMAMLGDRFNGEKALNYGLLTSVHEPAKLDSAVDSLAEKLCNLPPEAVSLNKQIVDFEYAEYLRRTQDYEIDGQFPLLQSEDFKESMQAFFEKRKPNYKGKA